MKYVVWYKKRLDKLKGMKCLLEYCYVTFWDRTPKICNFVWDDVIITKANQSPASFSYQKLHYFIYKNTCIKFTQSKAILRSRHGVAPRSEILIFWYCFFLQFCPTLIIDSVFHWNFGIHVTYKSKSVQNLNCLYLNSAIFYFKKRDVFLFTRYILWYLGDQKGEWRR
jgi:hypothetical protein